MTQREINARRNWKAEVFSADYYLDDTSEECLYCLTEKQAELLRGIIVPLGWKTRWWSEIGEIVQDDVEQFRNDIIERLMMSCCGDSNPTIYRYTVDGVLQRSDDGGTTWVDAPQNDIRTNATEFPPMEGADGTDKRCLAATGMRDLIKQQVGDNLTDDMTRYTLAQLITDWVTTMIGTSNPFQALLTIVVNQIFALVIAVLRPALTTGVYEQLLCIFYNNMSDDASFTSAQWEQVRTDILADITGIAGVFFEHLVYLLGERGLTNLARASGATVGSCGDCDEFWCFDGDFTALSYNTIFSGLNVSGGQDYATVWTSGVGWQTTNPSPNYSILVWEMADIPGLRYLKFTMTDNGDVTVDGRGDTINGVFTEQYQNPDVGLYWDGSPTNPFHMYGKRSAPIISAFHAEGVGANPFGTDNCTPTHIP